VNTLISANENTLFSEKYIKKTRGLFIMHFRLNRINPNQTQVFYHDGRFETLTNEEVEDLMLQMGVGEMEEVTEQNLMD
jgi:hypothetical protein